MSGINVGSSFNLTSPIPHLKNADFADAATRKAKGQLRHEAWDYHEAATATYWRIKPLAQCFLADGTTPATQFGTWGTLDAHWLANGGQAVPFASATTAGIIKGGPTSNLTFDADGTAHANANALRSESFAPTSEFGLVGDVWIFNRSATQYSTYKCVGSTPAAGTTPASGTWALRFSTPDAAATTTPGAGLPAQSSATAQQVLRSDGAAAAWSAVQEFALFPTRAALYASPIGQRRVGLPARVTSDSTTSYNGDYTVATDGYTWLFNGDSSGFQLLTASTLVVAGRYYGYTLTTARIFKAKVGQDPALGVIVNPVEADATLPGGTYWVEVTKAAATTTTLTKATAAEITAGTEDTHYVTALGLNGATGTLSALTTTAKGTLVAATNELQSLKAPLASPTFTGIPQGVYPSPSTGNPVLATQGFVLDRAVTQAVVVVSGVPTSYPTYAAAESAVASGGEIQLYGYHDNPQVTKSVTIRGGTIGSMTIGYQVAAALTVTLKGTVLLGRTVACHPASAATSNVTFDSVLTGPAMWFEVYSYYTPSTAFLNLTLRNLRVENSAAYAAQVDGLPGSGVIRFQERSQEGGSRWTLENCTLVSTNNAVITGYNRTDSRLVLTGTTTLTGARGASEASVLSSGVPTPLANLLIDQTVPAVQTLALSGTTLTLDATGRTTYNAQTPVLAANYTVTYGTFRSGTNGTLFAVQDATGGRTLTLPASPVSVNFTQPTAAANAVTEYRWFYDGTKLYWEVIGSTPQATNAALGTVRGGGTGNVNINADGSMTATAAAAAATFSSITGQPTDNANLNAVLIKSYPTFTALTAAATTTLPVASAYLYNATLSLTLNVTLAFTGLVSGATGTIFCKQDATGGRTVTLPASPAAIGTVAVNTAANSVTELNWIYDGTSLYWTSKQY
ncbi:MAG: hypothetical protein NVS3B25_07420 [Hymenobacter sp.]